jgi:hypothetical protein
MRLERQATTEMHLHFPRKIESKNRMNTLTQPTQASCVAGESEAAKLVLVISTSGASRAGAIFLENLAEGTRIRGATREAV